VPAEEADIAVLRVALEHLGLLHNVPA